MAEGGAASDPAGRGGSSTREARRFEKLVYRALAEELISPVRAAELLELSVADVERGLLVTTIVVNDASCLIDLRKGRLLHAMPGLPCRFIAPFAVRAEELLEFTAQEWQMIEDGDMEIYDLPPDAMLEAMAVKAAHPALSPKDAMCLVATRRHQDAVLLTGDGNLRRRAEAEALNVHGVLWLADQLPAANAASLGLLCAALTIWRDDPAVFLPAAEVASRLRRWAAGRCVTHEMRTARHPSKTSGAWRARRLAATGAMLPAAAIATEIGGIHQPHIGAARLIHLRDAAPLAESGRAQACAIGALRRAQGIAGAELRSSAWCRCVETPERLGLGPVTREPALDSFFADRSAGSARTEALRGLLRDWRAPRALVLVTHQVNITALTGAFPASGEALLVYAGVRAGMLVLRIPPPAA